MNRCWVLCMPGYFSFDFKNSISSCSQGHYSALQLAMVGAADKRGGLTWFIQILYLIFLNSTLILLVCDFLFTRKLPFFSKITLLICWDLEPEQQMGPIVIVKHRAGHYLASTSTSTKWHLCSGIKAKLWESSSAQKFIKTRKHHWEWSAMQISTVWYGSTWS